MAQTNNTADDRGRSRSIATIKVMLFSASIIPSVLAGGIASGMGVMNVPRYVLMFLGIFLGQLAGDYLYYYFTNFHTSKEDSHTKLFAGWKPFFVGGLIEDRRTLHVGIAILLIDALIGLYFILTIGWALVIFIAAGGLIAVFFTPLMLRGFKEVVIFLAFGPLAMVAMLFVLSGSFSRETLVASLPVALWVTAVAHLKSGKIKSFDQATGAVSLTVSKHVVLGLFAASYACLIAGVIGGMLPAPTLLALLTLPVAANVILDLRRPSSSIVSYLKSTIKTIIVLVIGGLLMTAGYLF